MNLLRFLRSIFIFRCTYQKECAPRPYCNKNDIKCDDLGAKIVQGIKNDRHNSLQIPGPIPVADTTNKDWKRSVLRHFSFDGKKKETQKNKSKAKKTMINKTTASDALTAQALNEGAAAASEHNEDVDAERREYREHRKRHSSTSKDSIEMHHKRLSNSKNKIIEGSPVGPPQEISLNNYYTHSDNQLPTNYNTNDRGTQMEKKSDQRPQGEETLQEHTIGE